MRKLFAGLAAVLLLAVVVQVFLAGYGAFNEAPNDESFQAHRSLGYVIFVLAVLVTIVGALARIPRRLIGMAGLVIGLFVVQVVIAVLAKAFNDGETSSTAGQLIFGLHAVNGLAIVAVVGRIVGQARALSRPAVEYRRGGDDAEASESAAEPAHPAAS